MKFMRFKTIISLIIIFWQTLALADMSVLLDTLPIQSGGRIKPFGTFAKESLQLIYGRSHYDNKAPSEVIFTWLLLPEHWSQIDIIEISRLDLKQNLKLDVQKKYFSFNTLTVNPKLSLIFQELKALREDRMKLNPYFQSIQRLEAQIQTFQAITSGMALALVPRKDTESWIPLSHFNESWKARFEKVAKSFIKGIQDKNHLELKQSLEDFIQAAKAENPSQYANSDKIAIELHYNFLSPFKWAWIFYVLASIFFLMALLGWRLGSYIGFINVALAFLLHTYGFILRVYLTERPPVSNMYESVIWVAWGTVFFALLFEWRQKRIFYILSACVVATLCLITADIAPTILDPSLQPLVPVLRSNLWLIVHVMTITLGYSAFFLAFVLSNIGLGWFFKDVQKLPSAKKTLILSLINASYYAIQVGVILLAAGTILGGVWADYSWGRFWGWDPKETWALIALLGYIAVIHGRLSGWLGNFGFLAWSSICFSLILMAWYGVNFVLGAGLHSYGFGGGGVEYVSAFVALHWLFVCTVTLIQRSYRLKTSP